MGDIQIFFGTVKSVKDEDKLFRCQISIPGYTDKLKESELPWYYPFNGLTYLPEPKDVVSVMIFDDNFVTGFYGSKLKLDEDNQSKLDGDDYADYLEIFKKQVSDKNVQLTYTKSKGIEFVNDKTGTKIETNKYLLFVESTSITIEKDKISIGSKNLEPTLLGDKTVKHLHNIIKHQQATIQKMYQGFQTIASACTTPFTAPIAAALASFFPTQAQLISENARVDSEADRIQSKVVSNQ